MGIKHINHPIVGDMSLMFQTLSLQSNSGIVITTYLTETGTTSADALDLLRIWTAQQHSDLVISERE
jgi:hypothetical protein